MNDPRESRVSELLAQIRDLEDELEDAIRTREVDFFYRLDGTRVRFERAVTNAHRKVRVSILRWLKDSGLRNVMSAPFIYSMILPFAFLDLFVTMYQGVCFPLYCMPTVSRARYIVMDRRNLSYLNAIERLNCVYCGYVNGLVGYVREISARTEQYFAVRRPRRREQRLR